MRVFPDSFGVALLEANPCHEPAGSSKGGQFCSTPGAVSTPLFKGEKARQRAVKVGTQLLALTTKLGKEVGTFFRSDGYTLAPLLYGDANSVGIPSGMFDEWQGQEHTIFVHTHPGGGPPTLADIEIGKDHQIDLWVLGAPNHEYAVQIRKKPSPGKWRSFMEHYHKAFEYANAFAWAKTSSLIMEKAGYSALEITRGADGPVISGVRNGVPRAYDTHAVMKLGTEIGINADTDYRSHRDPLMTEFWHDEAAKSDWFTFTEGPFGISARRLPQR